MELLAYLTEPLHPVLRGIVHSVEILPPEEAGVLGVIRRQVQEELRQQSGLPAESLGHDVDVGSVGSDGGVVRTSWVQRKVMILKVELETKLCEAKFEVLQLQRKSLIGTTPG